VSAKPNVAVTMGSSHPFADAEAADCRVTTPVLRSDRWLDREHEPLHRVPDVEHRALLLFLRVVRLSRPDRSHRVVLPAGDEVDVEVGHGLCRGLAVRLDDVEALWPQRITDRVGEQ
jgi:hypothetical protein